MTDNEIIKALECCINGDSCDGCPLIGDEVCTDNLRKYPLDLINHQKAEIERLEKANESFSDMGKLYSEIKSEAIKEFKKKFERKIKDVKFTLGQTWEIQNALKDTLKEMTERSSAEL